MENWQAECIVAAILASQAVDESAHSATYMVEKYRQVLGELRKDGGMTTAAHPK